MLNLPITRDGFMWAFSIACQIGKVPLATNFVMQKHQALYTLASFRAAAEESGIKLKQKAVPVSQLEKLALPCLAAMMPQTGAPGDADCEYEMALLEHIDERWVVFAASCSRAHTVISREEFAKRFAGEVLLIAPPVEKSSTMDAGRSAGKSAKRAASRRRPGLPWYQPEFSWLKSLRRTAR